MQPRRRRGGPGRTEAQKRGREAEKRAGVSVLTSWMYTNPLQAWAVAIGESYRGSLSHCVRTATDVDW